MHQAARGIPVRRGRRPRMAADPGYLSRIGRVSPSMDPCRDRTTRQRPRRGAMAGHPGRHGTSRYPLIRGCHGTGAAHDGRAPRGYGPENRISRHGTRCRISFPGGAQRIPGTRQPPRRASHVALGTDAVAGGEGVITPMFHFPSLRTGAAAPRAPGAAGGTAGSRTHRPPAAPPVWPPHPVPPSDFLENRTTPGLIKRQHLRPALESRSSPCPKHPVSPAPAHAGGNRHNAPLSA